MKKLGLVIILFMVFLTPSLVMADADTSSLTTLRNQVSDCINVQNASAHYEENSYNAFYNELTSLGGLAAVDAIISDPLSLQTTIDQMSADLERILSYLTIDSTYIAVMNHYYTEKSRVLTTYTARSIAIYEAELSRIKNLLDDPTTGEAMFATLNTDITASSSLLVLLGDKTDLLSASAEAEAIYLDGDLYLPQTYILFVQAYDAINGILSVSIGFTKEQVIASADASVNEVNETLVEINHALSLLVMKPDKTDFTTYYDNLLISLDEELYTPDSVSNYKSEIESINQEALKDETTSAELEGYLADLVNANNLLVLRADTSILEELNNQAIIGYYEEKSLYTEDSYQLFKTAVLAYGSYLSINAKMNDANITQAEVDALSAEIQNALDLLERQQDNTVLLEIYQERILSDDTIYTPNSVILYNDELARISVLIESKNLNESLYNETLLALNNVSQLLVLKADYSLLVALYNTALTYDKEDYSNSSYLYLQRMIDESEAIITNPNIDQTSVNTMVASLHTAIDQLKKPIGLITIHAGDEFNILDYVTMGEASIQGITSSNSSVLSVDGFGNTHGIKFGESVVTVYLSSGITETIQVLVKENVSTLTLSLAILVPVLASGLAAMTLYFKPEAFKLGVNRLWKKIKK
ncbi:MAG: hypothetical protein AB7U79_02875 [Candidatus Izemoplasmatales bacterium]